VGAIVYSRSRVVQADGQSTTPTMTFGPVGVLPEYRHRGIARMLIEKSLHLAKGLGCSACLIYGDPRIYGRLGFRCAEKWDVTNAQGDFVVCLMARELQSGAMQAMQGERPW
jgi:predicted N-acetyltransferase YhbS